MPTTTNAAAAKLAEIRESLAALRVQAQDAQRELPYLDDPNTYAAYVLLIKGLADQESAIKKVIAYKPKPRVDLKDPEVQAKIRRGILRYDGSPACQDAFCNERLNHEGGHKWDGNPE